MYPMYLECENAKPETKLCCRCIMHLQHSFVSVLLARYAFPSRDGRLPIDTCGPEG